MSNARQNAGQKMGAKKAGKGRDQPGAPGSQSTPEPHSEPTDRQPAKPIEQTGPHEDHTKHSE